ncbi:hypothetical protein [Roseofilum casamattae]|uniref:Uncharacterized protein n=1 Tax=Roseofilum casamattae BLCC-M143 TaxID=3022442 RepID=A0ABT7C079_9CYAN|nr:hypothetical protein [Roseofilum casamattae]MDJ1184862.1 hypothetical protein [Roseofilum casamattae BLCC-M143]
MATKQECSPLQLLRDSLQTTINTKLPYGRAFRVQCLLKDGMLMVLAQHESQVKPDTAEVFALLEESIGGHDPRISEKGRLFLRVAGEKRAYLSHSFALGDRPIIEPVAEPEPLPGTTKSRSLPFAGAIIGAIFVGIVAGGAYMLTRPCAIASCISLETAQRSRQVAVQTAQTTDRPQQLIEAREQLQEAIAQAKAIPFWSPYFDRAQAFIYANQPQEENLSKIVLAFSQATAASQLSLDPPHPLETWQEVEQLWQQAVQNLKQVSTVKTVYPLVKPKLKEYRNNLAAIEQRLAIEQEANQDLDRGKRAAELAKTRQGIAESVDNWQQVHDTWARAVNVLKSIPQGTQARVEANQFLQVYQTQFQASRERVLKEQIASETYTKALTLADKAKSLEKSNDLALAVGHWSQAVNYLRQVPSDSFYYSKSSPLVGSYQSSLQMAEAKLTQANRLQQARSDLNQTCAGLPRICEYTVTDKLFKVTLTADYVQTVRETLIQARGNGDLKTFTSVDQHVQSVQNALESISQTAKIPLELYDPDGKIMGTYVP